MVSQAIIARCVAANVSTQVRLLPRMEASKFTSAFQVCHVSAIRIGGFWKVEVRWPDRFESTGPFPDEECARAFAQEVAALAQDIMERIYARFLAPASN